MQLCRRGYDKCQSFLFFVLSCAFSATQQHLKDTTSAWFRTRTESLTLFKPQHNLWTNLFDLKSTHDHKTEISFCLRLFCSYDFLVVVEFLSAIFPFSFSRFFPDEDEKRFVNFKDANAIAVDC